MPAHCCAGGIALEQPDGMRRIIPIEDDQRTAIASSKDGARSGHGRAPAARTSVALFLLSAWPNKSASRSRAAPIDKLPTEAHPGGRRLAYATPAPPNPSSTNRPTSAPHSTALVNSATKATFGLTYDHAVSRRHRQPHANDAAVPAPYLKRPYRKSYASTYAGLFQSNGIHSATACRSLESRKPATSRFPH